MSKVGIPFVLALALVGCAEDETSTQVSGLRVFEQHAGDVAGTFTRGDAGLDFSFSHENGKHIAIIRSADGRPLIHSTLENDVETTIYLGRVTVRGSLQTEPNISGDPAMLVELAELPEAQLVEPLRHALEAQGIARDLYAIARAPVGRRCTAWSWWAQCDSRALISKL
jgi:hypothetical protein